MNIDYVYLNLKLLKVIYIIKFFILKGDIKLLRLILANIFVILFIGFFEMTTGFLLVILGSSLTNNNLSKTVFKLPFLEYSFVSVNYLLFFVAFASLLVGLLKVFSIDITHRLSGKLGSNISTSLSSAAVNRKWFIDGRIVSKSEFITTCVTYVSESVGVTNHFINMVSALIITFSIIVGLLIASPKLTLLIISLMSLFYFSSILLVRKPSLRISVLVANCMQSITQLYSEIYEIRREMFLMNRVNDWNNFVKQKYNDLADKTRKSALWSQSPRPLIETGVILFICLLLLISLNKNINIISTVTIVFVIIQKVLPSAQQVFNSISLGMNYNGSLLSVKKALIYSKFKNTIGSDSIKHKKINKKIKILNFKFEINTLPKKIKGELNLKRGQITTLIGKSGSRKTTIANTIIGEFIANKMNVIGMEFNKKNFKNI